MAGIFPHTFSAERLIAAIPGFVAQPGSLPQAMASRGDGQSQARGGPLASSPYLLDRHLGPTFRPT